MKLPDTEKQQIDFLIERARPLRRRIREKVYREAARQLLKDRKEAQGLGHVRPGPAEYLDLLRALSNCIQK